MAPPIGKSSAKPKFGSKISTSNAQLRRLKCVSVAKKKYYNEFDKATGLDYVGISDAPSRGLANIPFKDYQSRVAMETQKYNVEAANSLAVNRYGFLSPHRIRTNTAEINMARNIDFKKGYDLLQATTSPNSKSPANNFVGAPEVPTVEKTDINNLLSLNGVSCDASCQDKTRIQQVYNSLPRTNTIKDSSNYLSTGSAFVRSRRDIETAESGSQVLGYKAFNRTTNRVLKSDAVNILIEKTADSYRKPKPVNLNTIRGSLAYAELSASTGDFDTMNPLEQNANFNSVVRVEYLRSFGSDGRPLWKVLDTATFTRIQERSAPLLCRLSDPAQDLNVNNYFNVAPYDSVFVIGDSQLPTRPLSPAVSVMVDNAKNQLQQLFNFGELNYKGAGAPVLTQYLCSPSSIHLGTQRRGGAPMATGAPIASTTGGSY